MATETTNTGGDETSSAPPQRRPLYEASTQYRNWRFSPEQLAASRKSLNAAAVKGIQDLLEKESSIPELDQESAKRVHAAALAHMRAARLTDAELIYTPSQIAVACIYLADARMAETYLASKGSANMLTTVQEIAALIERDGKGADVALVKDIDRRLKLCKNPERVPGTKLFEARQARTDAAAERKRSLKAASTQESLRSQEEMFGPSIALPAPEGDVERS
ncbi:hypothetical protein FRC06_005874 [Ceratobasidium sp. 370]|nr:hypothetical protein FRC06_005874 [Ceratobasidium sp. 370]